MQSQTLSRDLQCRTTRRRRFWPRLIGSRLRMEERHRRHFSTSCARLVDLPLSPLSLFFFLASGGKSNAVGAGRHRIDTDRQFAGRPFSNLCTRRLPPWGFVAKFPLNASRRSARLAWLRRPICWSLLILHPVLVATSPSSSQSASIIILLRIRPHFPCPTAAETRIGRLFFNAIFQIVLPYDWISCSVLSYDLGDGTISPRNLIWTREWNHSDPLA